MTYNYDGVSSTQFELLSTIQTLDMGLEEFHTDVAGGGATNHTPNAAFMQQILIQLGVYCS